MTSWFAQCVTLPWDRWRIPSNNLINVGGRLEYFYSSKKSMEFYHLKGCNKIPPPLPTVRFLDNCKKSFQSGQQIFFWLNIFLNTNWGSVLLKPNIKVVKAWKCIRPLSSQSIYQKIELNFGLSPQPWNLYQYHIMHLWEN